MFLPTGQRIWEQLAAAPPVVTGCLTDAAAGQAVRQAWLAIEQAGRAYYDDMAREQQRQSQEQREKREYAFAARRRAIQRLGLPAVRQHRERQLAQEEATWQTQWATQAHLVPEVNLILLLHIRSIEREEGARGNQFDVSSSSSSNSSSTL